MATRTNMSALDLKVRLQFATAIWDRISELELSGVEAAARLGCGSTEITRIKQQKVEGFSVSKLCEWAEKLRLDVDVVFTGPSTDAHAERRHA
ncbi:XRE family transcriptional regulator [Nocardia ninae]|nr:XRE family transcriptional regulator [Nocardia ninae]